MNNRSDPQKFCLPARIISSTLRKVKYVWVGLDGVIVKKERYVQKIFV